MIMVQNHTQIKTTNQDILWLTKSVPCHQWRKCKRYKFYVSAITTKRNILSKLASCAALSIQMRKYVWYPGTAETWKKVSWIHHPVSTKICLLSVQVEDDISPKKIPRSLKLKPQQYHIVCSFIEKTHNRESCTRMYIQECEFDLKFNWVSINILPCIKHPMLQKNEVDGSSHWHLYEESAIWVVKFL